MPSVQVAKASAVNGTETVQFNRGPVLHGAIAFVAGKSVSRVEQILLHHDPVAGDFGND